jgi:hypothetical protein
MALLEPVMDDPLALRFDARTHRYTLGTRELPSVTTILKDAGLTDETWFTEESAARGTAIHQAVERLHASQPYFNVSSDYVGFMEAYLAFLASSRFLHQVSELRVYDGARGYAGTIDLLGALPGHRHVLIDIKTGSVPATVGPQTYAYARCLDQFHDRFALHLRADGTFTLLPLKAWRDDEQDFMAALRLYTRKRSHYGTR